MAFLGFGKKKTDPAKAPQQRSSIVPSKSTKGDKEALVEQPIVRQVAVTKAAGSSKALLGMRVTEKASVLSESSSVYTFNVSQDANKNSVSEAIEKLYKVTPVKVHITNIPAKRVFVRGKSGVKKGGRKAYVYLKKGEKIDIA